MALTVGEKYALKDGDNVTIFAREGGRAWGRKFGEAGAWPWDEDTGEALAPGQPDILMPSEYPPLPLTQGLRDAWNGADSVDNGIRRVADEIFAEWPNAGASYKAEFTARALQASDTAPPPVLSRPQFRFFLGETGLEDLYDAGVAALLASTNPQERYAGRVAEEGTQFYWYPTLAFGQQAAAAQSVTLDAVALRAAWDQAALLSLG